MEKRWNEIEELKTKTIKELAKEMFEYYKNDKIELFGALNRVLSKRDSWEEAYRCNVELQIRTWGTLETNAKRCAKNFAIYKELYNEFYALIRQSL